MNETLATMLKKGKSIFIVILFLSFFWGCGPSYEEKQQQKEVTRKEAIEKKRAEEKRLLSHLASTHNFVHFPPPDFTDNIFTYELQQYFRNQENNLIAFRGYIEDLEQIGDKIFIEFSCIISNEMVLDPAIIVFRLEASEKQATELMNNERPDSIDRLIGYFRDPDYLVVAGIKSILKIKKYEVSGSPVSEEEVEIEIETPIKFLGSGKLVEAVTLSRIESK